MSSNNNNNSNKKKGLSSTPILPRVTGDDLDISFTIFHSGLSGEVEKDEKQTIHIEELRYRLTPVFLGTTDTSGSIVLNKVSNFLKNRFQNSKWCWIKHPKGCECKRDDDDEEDKKSKKKIFLTEEDPTLSRVGTIILKSVQEFLRREGFDSYLVASLTLVTDENRVNKIYGSPPSVPLTTALI